MTPVVVGGALANRPGNGGGASVRMTWVAALRRLGFDVWFVEQMARDVATDAQGTPVPPERSVQVAFFRQVTRRFGLTDRCALLDDNGNRLVGARLQRLQQVAADSALLVNLGGHLRLPALLRHFRRRIYVDLDPGFTQYWRADGIDGTGIDGHDAHYTVGLNVGRSGCEVPMNGVSWRPLPPPVVLDEWPVQDGGLETFTTVASWRGPFGRVEREGRSFGLKVHEFRKFLDLPAHVPAALEIALDIHPADAQDLDALRQHGWRIVDPRQRVPDPDSYARYVCGSGAELSVAQGIYVETRCGWISDRTVRYLAAGRPALVQDTGLGDHVPVGEGLIVFRTFAEAVTGAEAIAVDYAIHRARARQLAEAYFDSDAVVGRLVEELGAAP
ncbi:MAG: glycosyltransferase [Thermoanaerobaculia bacterium]